MLSMFSKNFFVFALFTYAHAMFRTQQYDVFSKNRHARTCAAEMKTAHSKIACAMLCFGSDICCSASFYDGKCQLNTNCNGAKKPYDNAYAIQKPITNTDCKIDETGYNYKGTINKTVLGVTCQAWASQEPHKHGAEFEVSEANYCRNQDLEYPGPWCYTTDPKRRWDFCPVFKCGTECGSGFFLCDCGLCIPYPWRCNEIPDCPNSEDEQGCDIVPECLEDEKGLLYVGKINVTKSGNQCKPWKSRSVAAHFYHYSPRNYCRNVYGFDYNEPRCFTGGDYRDALEECDIPKCG